MQVKYNKPVLKKAMAEREMNLVDLAHKTGYSLTWVRTVLYGDRKTASKRVLDAFSKALDIPVDQVLVGK